MQEKTDALGDNNDTVYLRSDQFTLGDDPQEFVIVYGVNHTTLGKIFIQQLQHLRRGDHERGSRPGECDACGLRRGIPARKPGAQYLYVCKVAPR